MVRSGTIPPTRPMKADGRFAAAAYRWCWAGREDRPENGRRGRDACRVLRNTIATVVAKDEASAPCRSGGARCKSRLRYGGLGGLKARPAIRLLAQPEIRSSLGLDWPPPLRRSAPSRGASFVGRCSHGVDEGASRNPSPARAGRRAPVWGDGKPLGRQEGRTGRPCARRAGTGPCRPTDR